MDEEMKEVREKLEDAGFQVVDEVEIEDLTDVKEQRTLLPPTRGVKVGIRKATVLVNEAKTFRQLSISLALEDGIQVGEETKYKGMVIFTRIPYYADATVYNSDYFKNKQHLVEFKKLAQALGKDITALKVNDEFIAELQGQVLLADILQKTERYVIRDGGRITINKKNPALEGEEIYSEVSNEVRNFKALPTESQV